MIFAQKLRISMVKRKKTILIKIKACTQNEKRKHYTEINIVASPQQRSENMPLPLLPLQYETNLDNSFTRETPCKNILVSKVESIVTVTPK